MTKGRWILLSAVLALTLVGSWLLWMKPSQVDMAAYAPAESLLYIESDRPAAVIESVIQTEAWRAFERASGLPHSPASGRLQKVVGWTGIGPIESVLLARSQIAVVVTKLDTTESGDTLKIKSEGAILIETHTSERRIRSPFEAFLKSFAEKLYEQPNQKRITENGVEFIEWLAPGGSRQIVGTVAGSLLIIGTSEEVVKNCLAVSQGRRPSLKADAELAQMRSRLGQNSALTFGYVPPGSSGKLLAFAIPLLLGRAPGDSDFQRLITTGASKSFGSLAWSSRAYQTGIEDRYLITLQHPVVDRLKPNFGSLNVDSQLQAVVPENVSSLSSYRFREPEAAWRSLKVAVASQVDTLSGVVFSALLKSSLLSYGIDDPETFLATIGGEILTLRLDEAAERSLLIAGVRNQTALRELLRKTMKASHTEESWEEFEDLAGDISAGLSNDYVVIGSPSDVQRYATLRKSGAVLSAEKLKQLTFYRSPGSAANVVTYTNDANRVRNFFATIAASRTVVTSTAIDFESLTASLPYSVTESVLVDEGVERITRSPLGQFSSLLPLVLPEKSASQERNR